MKLKDWVAVTNGIDEFDIHNSFCYFSKAKNTMLIAHGEDEIDEIFIQDCEEDTWVVAKIYLK